MFTIAFLGTVGVRFISVYSGVRLTSWGEGASLVLVGHPSSEGVTIRIPYGVIVLLH